MIDVKQILDAGEAIADAHDKVTEVGGIPVAITRNDAKILPLVDVLKIADERAPNPRDRRGTAELAELASFCAHVNRFKDADSVIYADIEELELLAILDYSPGTEKATAPRWGRHRSKYACPRSTEWDRWMAINGKPMKQDAFGDFLDAHADNLASKEGYPKAAELISMARHLTIRTKGAFERSVNPTTGEYTLVNTLEHESTSTRIWPKFLLGLRVFANGVPYEVEARLQFTMQGGAPIFTVSFPNADVVLADAFTAVRKTAEEKTGLPVFAGSPE